MPDDSVLIHGFAPSGYRSFMSPGDPLAPLGKVNLLAGQNNAGKSNVLRFARDYLSSSPATPSAELDRPETVLPQDWEIQMRLYRSQEQFLALGDEIDGGRSLLQILLSAPGLKEHEYIPFRYILIRKETFNDPNRRQWEFQSPSVDDIAAHLLQQRVNPMIAANLFRPDKYSGGGSPAFFTSEILARLAPDVQHLPPVRVIQAFRQIRPAAQGNGDDVGLFDGLGLVERLQQLENPREIGASRDELRSKFDKITSFVRRILDDQSAILTIPYDASTIQVERNSRVLPLESLGTGVQQVVMLAAASTLLSNTLIGLEEPEVHLHPLLQRRLVKYLSEETDNQYLIATHSAHLLDYDFGKIFHLTYTPSGTEVARAGTPREVSRICADLGYRPSDLLQSNATIWVEGPSDRIYVRYWINAMDRQLIEGIHYSIMFYGGSLLRHLTPDDPDHPGLSITGHEEALEDFISLRRLNRHLAILIDSDKTSARKHLNATKIRVKNAFEEGETTGHAWVTDGYTIENYVPRDLLEKAVAAVHPRQHLVADEGNWANPLRLRGKVDPDKVAIARYVTRNWPQNAPRNAQLERRVQALVDLIHLANGHTSSI